MSTIRRSSASKIFVTINFLYNEKLWAQRAVIYDTIISARKEKSKYFHLRADTAENIWQTLDNLRGSDCYVVPCTADGIVPPNVPASIKEL